MKKKDVTKVLAIGLAAFMLTGCGGAPAGDGSSVQNSGEDTQEQTGEQSGEQAQGDAQQDAGEESGEAESGEKVEITFFHHFAEEGMQNWIADRNEAFMEKYPNIIVNQEIISADAYSQTIQTKIASDDAPMIMVANTGKSFLVKFSQAGHLADLTGIEGLENINEKILPDGQVDGKQYGITIDQNAFGVFYNKDMFAENNLEIPQTLSEMDQVCAALEAKGIQPFVTGYGQLWVVGATLKIYEDVLCGPDWYTQHENLEASFSGDEKYARVMELFMRYRKYWEEDPFGTDSEDAYDAIANGEAAMTINGTWMVDAVEQRNPDCNLGFFPMPMSEDPSGTIVDLVPGSPLCVYNTEDPAKLDAAKKYISFLLTEESCNAYATMAKKLSTCPAVDFSFSKCLQEVVDIPADRQYSMAGHERFSDQYNTLQNELVQKHSMMDTFDFEALTAELDSAFTTAVK